VNILCDEAGNLGGGIPNDIEQSYDIGTSSKVLKNLDFTLDFLLLHWFEDLDDAFLLGHDIDALENLKEVSYWRSL
jgi:hypothetical protein